MPALNPSVDAPALRRADVKDIEKHLGYIEKARYARHFNTGYGYFGDQRADVTERFYAPEMAARLLDERERLKRRLGSK